MVLQIVTLKDVASVLNLRSETVCGCQGVGSILGLLPDV